MSFCRPNAPLSRGESSISADVALLLELAEAPVDAPFVLGPSHHADGSEWLGGDWLDDGAVEELAWCVSVSTAALSSEFPQSPTSVDCSSASRTASDVSMDGLESARFEREISQLRMGATMRDPRLKETVKEEEQDEDDDDGDVKPRPTAEALRRRQRGYENAYRKKRRSRHRSDREEWATLEFELHALLQQHTKPLVKDRRPRFSSLRQQYMRLLRKERALQADRMMLRAIGAWTQMFALRNYGEHEIQPVHEEWAAMDRKLLGPCVIKPFRPLRFEFKW